ncbi:hypothetical protein DERP_004715 [Dermatophagoides pteronyssinus]|uniref:U7 snRNA-associated Sm-like protein LSm10 n=2 Tax=Dermatophagoides pteronyssinus TaxID=6956 RepID=A0A6P6Y8L2_DERPT|nr:U7 snRNA-associated Sm-like protein LSm10 [Dermatophagoides pteronyssinus]KAH9424530.1 hypothetical protein DERP_004715 [Dermatophagoides pteronyssinus]
MAQMTTASKEIAKSTRTLICLLQSLIDHRVLIELRNDHFVLGMLQSVDCYMNCESSSAKIWSLNDWIEDQCHDNNATIINLQCDRLPDTEWLDKHSKQMDYIFIKGNRIRFIHLPEEINIIDCIEKQLKFYRERNKNVMAIQRPFNWKDYRKKLKSEIPNQQQQQQDNDNNKSITISLTGDNKN